jgi:hypothetical protein
VIRAGQSGSDAWEADGSMLIGHGWTVEGKSVTFADGLASGLTVGVVELSVRLPLDDSGQFNLTLSEHPPRKTDLA